MRRGKIYDKNNLALFAWAIHLNNQNMLYLNIQLVVVVVRVCGGNFLKISKGKKLFVWGRLPLSSLRRVTHARYSFLGLCKVTLAG